MLVLVGENGENAFIPAKKGLKISLGGIKKMDPTSQPQI